MQIVFLEAVQNFGGARKSTLELAARLKSRGSNVLVVDFWGSCQPFLDKADELEVPVRVIDKREEPFLLYNKNKIKMLFNYVFFIFLWAKYKVKVDKILNSYEADLVVVNNVKTLSILSRKRQYRIAYFARGWFLPNTISFLQKTLIKRMVSIFLAVSQSTRQSIFAGGFAELSNIIVVPNAVSMIEGDCKKIPSSCHEDDVLTLLHCGGFLETKGQHVVVNIAKKLRDEGVKIKVYLLGVIYKGEASKDYYNSVVQTISENNLTDVFEIIVDEHDIQKYFKISDVLVHPTSTEGLPRVVMEAMSMGKPVVGNAVGGMTDFIIDNYTGFLPSYNNVDDYVSCLKKLHSDKMLYDRLSVASKNLISELYTIENQCRSFERIEKFLLRI